MLEQDDVCLLAAWLAINEDSNPRNHVLASAPTLLR